MLVQFFGETRHASPIRSEFLEPDQGYSDATDRKSTIIDSIDEHSRTNPLNDYRRRFDSQTETQVPTFLLPSESRQHHRPESGRWEVSRYEVRNALPQIASVDAAPRRRDRAGRVSRSKTNLIAGALVGAIGAVAIEYVYRIADTGGSEVASPAIRTGAPSIQPAVKGKNEQSSLRKKKSFYDRLTPDEPQTPPEPASAALPARENAPQSSPNLPSQSAKPRQDVDQPTVVRSETYRPDGTRIDPVRSAALSNIVTLNAEQSPQPSEQAAPVAAPIHTPAVPSVAQSASVAEPGLPANPTPAAPPASLANGYFVQIKSNQDEKAAEDDLRSIGEKYKPVLNEIALKTKSVDLGQKGVWFRLLAGPLTSRDEASDLCTKLKRSGLPACIIYKSE